MLFFVGVGLLATLLQSTPPPRIGDPESFVRAVYKKLQRDETAKGPVYQPPEDIYTPRLNRLFSEYRQRTKGEVGCLDFGFWINAQDSTLTHLDITSRRVPNRPNHEIVTAKFDNGSVHEEIEFDFQRSAGAWLLDEVRSLKDRRWTLSDLLRCKS